MEPFHPVRGIKKGASLAACAFTHSLWCRRPDSNRHEFPHHPLKMACLPSSTTSARKETLYSWNVSLQALFLSRGPCGPILRAHSCPRTVEYSNSAGAGLREGRRDAPHLLRYRWSRGVPARRVAKAIGRTASGQTARGRVPSKAVPSGVFTEPWELPRPGEPLATALPPGPAVPAWHRAVPERESLSPPEHSP